MRHLPLFMCTAFCGLYSLQTEAADKKNERPNILWLTFEDTSAYEFGCYGNGDVHTPNADSLAARGIQFMNAWSVAPQSSAARSSLITGCYSSTYGMDIHPVPYDTPADIFFPQRLREAGYYCTNIAKHIITLLQITKAVGTNVTIKLLTIVPNVERISLSSLYITQ